MPHPWNAQGLVVWEESQVVKAVPPDHWGQKTTKVEETFKIFKYNYQPSTTTVIPKPLNHMIQCLIQIPPKHLHG